MYVRKFEADSLDEALKEIKRELGPDAIILKTVSNKGLKGAFKKKKIEITAAISEKNYTDKIKVDDVLNNDQKDLFYANASSTISNDIALHAENSSAKISTYGNIGLNKKVNSTSEGAVNKQEKRTDDGIDLDSFLNDEINIKNDERFLREEKPVVEMSIPKNDKLNLLEKQENISGNGNLQRKLDQLEVKFFELTKNLESFEKKEASGIFQLRSTLKSLDVNDGFIQKVLKKALFEFSQEELDNPDLVYEFALREMVEVLNVGMPLFSKINEEKDSAITILLSDISCGQSSMALKLATLKPNCIVIRRSLNESPSQFTQKVFNLQIVEVETIPQVISEIRKAKERKKTVFIDFQNLNKEVNEIKQFIEDVSRSFENTEVLTCLSAIHSELYNKKILNQYKSISQGIILSQLDLCLNFGALFNLYEFTESMPFVFFGTGRVIPDDIEGATAERILAGIFQL